MKKLFTLASFVIPVALFAHSGHGILDGNNFFHYIANAEHGILTLLLAGVVAYLMYRSRKKATSH